MTYTEWLEKEINIYKRENKLLNDKLENLNNVYSSISQDNNKKKEVLKWSYTLQKENKQLKDELKEANSDVGIFIEEEKELKQRIKNLVSENTKLQNDLFTEQLIQDEQDDYIDKLKLELFELYRNKQ